MRTWWISIGCVTGVALLQIGCGGTATEDTRAEAGPAQTAVDRPAALPVVKTWGELDDAPILRFGDGHEARAGISATTVPVNSAVLIYCRSAAPLPKSVTLEGRDILGPLLVRVRKRGATHRGMASMIGLPRTDPTDRTLYVHSAPLAEAGTYDITVLDHAGDKLATAEVAAVEQPLHGWTTFFSPPRTRQAMSARDRDRLVGHVSNGTGRALPRFDGAQPIELHAASPDTALPALLPDSEPPQLRLVRKNDDLRIDADEPMSFSQPQWRYLARWWVNDKPFQPQPDAPREVFFNGLIKTARHVTLHLDFVPQRLGAETGDRIGLQLLYCPHGWEYVDAQVESLHAISREHLPRISNRVEWTVEETR